MPIAGELRDSFRQARMPLATLTILILVGATIAAIFGSTMQDGGWTGAVSFLAIMGASVSVGSLTGFLFGIPRFEYRNRDAAATMASGKETDPRAALAATAERAAPSQASYRPSTNLDDIADWLTKIIVGIGLTQLTKIGPALGSIARQAIAPCANCERAEGFVSAMILYGSIGGFLFAYMWTRLHYANLAARSDLETNRTIRQFEITVATEFGVGGKGPKPQNMPGTASSARAAPDLAGGAEARPRGASDLPIVADDPNKNQFGCEPIANGRILRARIDASEYSEGVYRITLTVSAHGDAKKLEGAVTFHLHPTFTPSTVTVAADGRVATLTVLAYGAFTVGAVADGGQTKLELDLARHPDAPEDFRSR